MLTCVIRAQVKELKMEIQNKFYVENITFETFKILNAQFSSKNFYIWFLNLYASRTQVNISLKRMYKTSLT